MIKLMKNLTKKDLLFVCICAAMVVLQVWLDLTMPDYTQKLTESVSSGALEMSTVLKNGGMMLLCALGSMAASIVCGFFAARVAANFAKTLRQKLFDRITDFSDAEINHFSTPSLITRTTNDVVQMQMLIAIGLQVLIKAPVLAVWAITKISATSVEWTSAVAVCVAIMIFTIVVLVLLAYPKFKQIQKLTDKLNDVTRENISGVRVVRAFNAEEYQQEKFARVNEAITRNHLFTSRTLGIMMPVMTVSMSGLTLAIYWIGAYLINRAGIMERATLIGNMAAFTQYALQVVAAFIMLVAIFIVMPRTMVSARRIQEVLSTEPVIIYPGKPVEQSAKGRIEFKNVSFAYADGDKPCIRDLTFTVEPGQTFAIIGATGSGKTTLINLIPRFYDATKGEVLINGRNVKDYPKEQLEKEVSLAPQKAILFMGDIKSNVTYGSKREVPDDDPGLKKALEIAKAEFVSELPEGIHSAVAQGGTNFSGGQKQRLSIARAVFKGAGIIIFDDTFSALDYKTDMLVRRSLNEELKDTTVMIVAQRIGTIKNADQILVLHEGKIAGLGKHEELLENCPIYKEIALSQLREEEL
ncbi:MAG: ABC transporter ATP-binding protein/permease [Lachnospiraceae bacterium]|nr:ABC transporter ATP-binding protein/permease [Lachnospiraceae bacterium]